MRVKSTRAPDDQILGSIAAIRAIHARYIRCRLGVERDRPVVRLRRIVGAADADVVIKLEALNLTGSYKDHMALALIAAVLILVGR
jgi:hypothetical protein